jgi:hypothetical protein
VLLFNLLYAGQNNADEDLQRLELLYDVLCAPPQLTEEGVTSGKLKTGGDSE